MNLRQASELEAKLMEEVTRRRGLGGYSQDAPTLLLFAETLYEMARHIRMELSEPRKKNHK